MSTTAQKSRNRLAHLRNRGQNDIAGWDDGLLTDANAVFVGDTDETQAERLDGCIAAAGLHTTDRLFLDGGVLLRFPRKRDADLFRACWTKEANSLV